MKLKATCKNVLKYFCVFFYRRMEVHVQPGSTIRPTVDVFTRPASVLLVNKSSTALSADYNAIHDLSLTGELFSLV